MNILKETYLDHIYYENGRKALVLVKKKDRQPFSVLSINLPHHPLEEDEIAIKTWSENDWVLEFLLENEIVFPPHRCIPNGFVVVPICRLPPGELDKWPNADHRTFDFV